VLNRLLTEARRLQFIADWLDLRRAQHEDQQLRARYKKEQEEAQKRHEEFHPDPLELRWIWEPIDVQRTTRLVARAHKYGVRPPPFPHDDAGDNNWEWSRIARDWYLTKEAEEHLKRETRAEKRQSDDELRKWATLAISIAAFILALVSLTAKQKQPDPCPKNYYRGDSGECVFAPQKTSQQVATPAPSLPKKPSPSTPKP
jgi:hypothetical protein